MRFVKIPLSREWFGLVEFRLRKPGVEGLKWDDPAILIKSEILEVSFKG